MAWVITEDDCFIILAESGVSRVTVHKTQVVLVIIKSGEPENNSGVDEIQIKSAGKYTTQIPYTQLTVGSQATSAEDARTKILAFLNTGDCSCCGADCVDHEYDVVVNGDFATEVDINFGPETTPDTWFVSEVAYAVSGEYGWNGFGLENGIGFVRGDADDGGGFTVILNYCVYDGVDYLTTIDSTITQNISVDITSIEVRSGKSLILTLVDYIAGKYIQVDLSSEPYGTYTQQFAPGDWVVGTAPGEGTLWQSDSGINFGVEMDSATASGMDDDYYLDNVEFFYVVCCNDTEVDFVTNGDFVSEVFPGAPIAPNVWSYFAAGLIPPVTFAWAAGEMQVRINTPDAGGGGGVILGYSVFDGVSVYSPNIDSSVDQTFSMDIESVVVRSGKFNMITLIDYDNGKYIQLDISAEPYGTFTQTFVPADWTVGVAPGVGSFWEDGFAISFFTNPLDATGSGADDDFNIDNISLTHVECI